MARFEPALREVSGDPADEIETGNFASTTVAGAERTKLVIASYNIRYAVGSFLITGSIGRRLGLSRPNRRQHLVARHLQKAAASFSDAQILPPPDILALQEADKQTSRAGGHHIARELAQKLHMNYAFATSTPGDEKPKSKQWFLDFEERLSTSEVGATGVALLSRVPFTRLARIELPWRECPWRPRLALAATFQIGRRTGHIINSHIDPHASIKEQLEQHEAVLSAADKLSGLIILLGDFNTLTKRSRFEVSALLNSRGYRTPFPTGTATWRAGLIRLQTDWIFIRGAQAQAYGVARPLSVSDHWPVWAEIDLGSEESR